VILIATIVAVVIWKPWGPSVDEQRRQLRLSFLKRDYDQVLEIAQSLKKSDDFPADSLLMAGEAATKLGELSEAAAFYGGVEIEDEIYPEAQLALAEVYRAQCQITFAESAYQRVLQARPNNSLAHSRLALLQMLSGRPRDAESHLNSLLQQRTISWQELCWLAAPDRGVSGESYLQKCRQQAPMDPAPTIGLATLMVNRGDPEKALELLDELGSTDGVESQVRKIRLKCELKQGISTAVMADARALFEQYRIAEDSDGLYLLGLVYERNSQLENAVACFAASVAIRDNTAAMQNLIDALRTADPSLNTLPLQQRTLLLSRLESLMKSVRPDSVNLQAAGEVSQIMTELERNEEAVAWRTAAGLPEQQHSVVAADPADVEEVINICLRRFPMVSPASPSAPQNRSQDFDSNREDEVAAILNIASEVGLNFTYFESPDENTPRRRMFEFTGGGVGVLDLDGDTWPDLLFTQGAVWPPNPNDFSKLDTIYRNVRGERLADVTDLTALKENGFSQGVACGDLDNDGFPDVVVANIGANTYWRNQGDGTFSPFTLGKADATPHHVWTSSCAVADINFDGLPDIIEVNYLQGKDIGTLICETPAGPRVCAPHAFMPTQDEIWLNQGDGSFVPIGAQAGVSTAGNGLGLIVANLDADPMPEIFVANDAMPNFLWDNIAGPGEPPLFQDVAVTRGVALSSEGRAQACMGIAAADFNADGTIDLFVTNYFNEPNALYLLSPDGLATEASAMSEVATTSMRYLGFGAQALFANEDDLPDIFLVNGDLDEFSHEGRSLNMPPQLLLNVGNGLFRESRPSEEGDIRHSAFRGRGMARLDWNQDGYWDFAVSCLDTPSQLLVQRNRPQADTELASKKMVTLVGRTAYRDAFGTEISYGEQVVQRAMSGDGYMASNQKRLLIRATQEDLRIRWPGSGSDSTVSLPPEQACLIIEGRDTAWRIPR